MMLNFSVTFADSYRYNFRVMNDVNNQVFTWTFDKKPVQFNFDPNDEIVLKQGTTVLEFPNLKHWKDSTFTRIFQTQHPMTTKIVYELKKDSHIHLDIMDISGKIIASPVDENTVRGKHWVDIDCSIFAPGIYFYTMQAGGYSQTRKMIITK